MKEISKEKIKTTDKQNTTTVILKKVTKNRIKSVASKMNQSMFNWLEENINKLIDEL